MIVIYILLPVAAVLAAAGVAAFVWAVKSGQFEDTCTPAMRILSEDEKAKADLPVAGEAPGAAG